MIVHLFEDQKFVDQTIVNFDNVSEKLNRYIILSNNSDLKHVSSKDRVSVIKNSSYDIDLDLIYQDCHLLMIHFLTPVKLYVIKNRPQGVKVLWSIWGSDAYDHFNQDNLFEPLTNVLRTKNSHLSFRSSMLYRFYHFIRYRVKPISRELNTLGQLDYISTVLPYEFETIRDKLHLNAEYIDFNYSVNKFKKDLSFDLGDSVLVGNSATFSNNHLDVFAIIKDIDKKIITPLSYGAFGYQKYSSKVIDKGYELFHKNFLPITRFLALNQYEEILVSCNTMIMYHIRQQALGNIYMALFMGIRVFLNKKSITYRYMIDVGMVIFELEDDINLVGVELSKEEKDINRKLVVALQGEEAILRKIKGILELN